MKHVGRGGERTQRVLAEELASGGDPEEELGQCVIIRRARRCLGIVLGETEPAVGGIEEGVQAGHR